MDGHLPHFFVPRADLISDLRDDSEGDETDDICSERGGTHRPHPDLSFRLPPSYLGQPRQPLALVVSENKPHTNFILLFFFIFTLKSLFLIHHACALTTPPPSFYKTKKNNHVNFFPYACALKARPRRRRRFPARARRRPQTSRAQVVTSSGLFHTKLEGWAFFHTKRYRFVTSSEWNVGGWVFSIHFTRPTPYTTLLLFIISPNDFINSEYLLFCF